MSSLHKDSMLLIHGEIKKDDDKYQPTFKLVPFSEDCPYNEMIYDVETKVLFIIGKNKKQSIKKIESKDVLVETYYEYHIINKEEIIKFITLFGHNSTSFPYQQFLN